LSEKMFSEDQLEQLRSFGLRGGAPAGR